MVQNLFAQYITKIRCVKYATVRVFRDRYFPYKDRIYDYVHIRESMCQKTPVFWHILRSDLQKRYIVFNVLHLRLLTKFAKIKVKISTTWETVPLSEHALSIKYLKGKIILSYDTWIDVKRKKFHFSEIWALITFPKQDKKVYEQVEDIHWKMKFNKSKKHYLK